MSISVSRLVNNTLSMGTCQCSLYFWGAQNCVLVLIRGFNFKFFIVASLSVFQIKEPTDILIIHFDWDLAQPWLVSLISTSKDNIESGAFRDTIGLVQTFQGFCFWKFIIGTQFSFYGVLSQEINNGYVRKTISYTELNLFSISQSIKLYLRRVTLNS